MHVLLDAKVVDGQAEMEYGHHRDRRKIGSAVVAGADMVESSEVRVCLACVMPPPCTIVMRM